MINDIIKKYKFDINSDRLGPDCIFTHWKLYFKKTMKKLCKNKFGSFGNNSEFRPNAYAFGCSKIFIGNRVVIRPNTILFSDINTDKNGQIIIKNDVLIGMGVHIYVANHKYDLDNKNIIEQGHSKSQTVVLEEGCWIGANTVILPGVTIGKNSVVGAGSIVTKNVPKRTVFAGNPAKLIKKIRISNE
jgi:acetyltransferase-like isoleucine patch superfamily enzyme